MVEYGKHKEDYARCLRELTDSASNVPDVALRDYSQSVQLLGEALAKQGCVRLYKYQPFNERNVRDFLEGAMHMSSPDSFNDVNEGWQRFDEATVRGDVDRAMEVDIEGKLADRWDGLVEAMRKAKPCGELPSKGQVVELWETLACSAGSSPALADSTVEASRKGLGAIRGLARCASLSETVSSASMWDRYAHGNEGFAIGYDFAVFNPSCGLERKRPEGPEAVGLLAPVLYGKRADLSMLFMACCLWPRLRNPINNIYYLTMVNMFARKAAEWGYEREWRVLAFAPSVDTGHLYVRKKPDAVYLGLKMKPDEKDRLIEAAERAGLDVYSMVMDLESEDYSLKPVRVG